LHVSTASAAALHRTFAAGKRRMSADGGIDQDLKAREERARPVRRLEDCSERSVALAMLQQWQQHVHNAAAAAETAAEAEQSAPRSSRGSKAAAPREKQTESGRSSCNKG